MSIVLKRFVFTIVYKNKHVYSNSITFYSISVSPYMPLWVWLWSYKKIIWSVNHHHHRFSLSNTGPVSHGRIFKNGMEMTEKERKWKIAHWHSSINTMPCDAGTMISFNGPNENRIFMDFFFTFWKMCRVSGFLTQPIETILLLFLSQFQSFASFHWSHTNHACTQMARKPLQKFTHSQTRWYHSVDKKFRFQWLLTLHLK